MWSFITCKQGVVASLGRSLRVLPDFKSYDIKVSLLEHQ